ncbi:hypothetical protein LXA43DRAFT_1101726 [Ganoderma leucocontextum]|nr:hypothetical protein LXA43DRAFT_1101726 [Ganoderma leucocontextum]
MSDENLPHDLGLGQKRPSEDSVLTQPPRKKAAPSDPWKLKGRHIGRSIHAFANFAHLILDGIQLDKDLSLSPDNEIEKYSTETRLRYNIYTQIIQFLPDLEEGLTKENITTSQLNRICASIQAGANAARADDVKGLKGAILDWITDKTTGLVPPIARNKMDGRGFNHEATGKELCPAGLDWNDPSIKSALKAGTMVVQSDQWSIFLYLNGAYDPERPWAGLLRGRLLVNAFKHVFTSPSSVEDAGRSTKSSNAALHGMTKVTLASIAYVATLVRFSLSSRATFARSDTVTDSQTFYNVLLAFLTHPDERENANELLVWWNKQVFPNYVATYRAPTVNSALAKLMEARKKRAALREVRANLTA